MAEARTCRQRMLRRVGPWQKLRPGAPLGRYGPLAAAAAAGIAGDSIVLGCRTDMPTAVRAVVRSVVQSAAQSGTTTDTAATESIATVPIDRPVAANWRIATERGLGSTTAAAVIAGTPAGSELATARTATVEGPGWQGAERTGKGEEAARASAGMSAARSSECPAVLASEEASGAGSAGCCCTFWKARAGQWDLKSNVAAWRQPIVEVEQGRGGGFESGR